MDKVHPIPMVVCSLLPAHLRRQKRHRRRATSASAATKTPKATSSTKAQVCSFRQHSAVANENDYFGHPQSPNHC